jgi:hypothetical protein
MSNASEFDERKEISEFQDLLIKHTRGNEDAMDAILHQPFVLMGIAARYQHDKDRAEIEDLRLALEDREKMHDQHCQFFEAERLRDRARITELDELVREAIPMGEYNVEFRVPGAKEWLDRATRALDGDHG